MTQPAQNLQEYLASFQQPWKAGFEARLSALPADLAATVRAFLREERDDEKRRRSHEAFVDLLHGSDAQRRLALAGAFFPGFPETAARTLEAVLTRHPYTQGYARRAFRAPGHRLQAVRAASWWMGTWNITRDFPQDLEWFAVHAGLLSPWQSHGLGLLLAQALDDGDETVFGVLRDTAGSQHPVARMGRHVPMALLASSRPDAWDLAQGLLLAAQRQEGLRQVILEAVDEAHPEAFTRFLGVILDEDLLRFAACLRAADVWFGLNYDVGDVKTVRQQLTQARGYLEDPASARAAVEAGAGLDAYLALFTLAMRNAEEAADLARPLLAETDPERRMAAVQFLQAAERLEGETLDQLITDPDLRLGALAVGRVNRWNSNVLGLGFGAVETYAARLPGEARHEPLLFPWLGQIPARGDVVDLLPSLLGERPLAALTPHLPHLSSYGRSSVLSLLKSRGEKKALEPDERALLMALLQDRNSSVSQEAVGVAAHLTLAPDAAELDVLHGLLKRRSADLRRGLIRLLARDRGRAAASAALLLATRNAEQRQAGLQLLLEVGGEVPEGFTAANTTEETLLAQLTRPEETLTLENGLGLFDPSKLAPLPEVRAHERDYAQGVRRGAELLKSLDDLIHLHREDPLSGPGWDGETTVLLGNVSPWSLRGEEMPFAELWRKWWEGRSQPEPGDLTRMGWALRHHAVPHTRTAEQEAQEAAQELELSGLLADLEELGTELEEALPDVGPEEIAREAAEQAEAQAARARSQRLRQATLHRLLGPPVPLRLEYSPLVGAVLNFLRRTPEEADADLALDAWETGLSYLPRDVETIVDPEYVWRKEDPRELLSPLRPFVPWAAQTPGQQRRLWALTVYNDRAFSRLVRSRPAVPFLIHAEEQGWASRHDLLDTLIGPREGSGDWGPSFSELRDYTVRTLRENVPTSPAWTEAVNEVRERVLEVELARGDLETPATRAALSLQSVTGMHRALRLLARMGKNPLRRGYSSHNENRDNTFSHLIRVSFPGPDDTPAAFAALVKELGISDARLLDLAMFAPQWSALVAATLGWKGLQDGVYWMHAHTRDASWSVPAEIRAAWEAEISERTPLTPQTLTEGAVDVAWFRRTYRALGAPAFAALLNAAKYASSSGGHKRAELFARALLGEVAEDDLRTRITAKRSGDAVRALGLLPLSRGKVKAAREVEGRYRLLSDFRREARQFGAQRQASERLAADIGMQNLARTAGYTDPQRLMWAMEACLAPDWGQTVEANGVTVRIEMTDGGEASLRVQRGERLLKALPPALKKLPELVQLRAALTELEATRGRMRAALEEAMVRGDHFQPQELRDLARHPVIAPMLRSLVWVLNEGPVGWWQGESLRTPDGEEPVADQALRLAHPHDLFTSGHWPAFQTEIIERGIVQPFKQVFREYYPPTEAEREARRSTRYDGHHVQPTQAAALFKARGWVAVQGEGVRKTYHAEGVNVWVDTAIGYGTPNEVEGTPLSAVYFIRRDEREPMKLGEVPPRLFSETLRDLDLVVSVAHVGGVDPEASQSTVEMRAGLLKETLRLLKLGNVRLENNHALIEGQYARYSVHLGSGTVHRLPGGFLCVIPVHNAHAGRIFLPFADPDPRTAEVISKVLLLAEDRKIQDPTILEQLR